MKRKYFIYPALLLIFTVILGACSSKSHNEDDDEDDDDIEMRDSRKRNSKDRNSSSNQILGNWYALIQIPQNDLKIIENFNFYDDENCRITVVWIEDGDQYSESGEAKYYIKNDKLYVKFLNEDERIKHDNIYDLENEYDLNLTPDRMVFEKDEQTRGQDLIFSRNPNKPGECTITF